MGIGIKRAQSGFGDRGLDRVQIAGGMHAQKIIARGHRCLHAAQVHAIKRGKDRIHPRYLFRVAGRGNVAQRVFMGDQGETHGASQTRSGAR